MSYYFSKSFLPRKQNYCELKRKVVDCIHTTMENEEINNLTGPKSILNVDAQKEVITHTFAEARKNLLIIFPIVMLSILAVVVITLLFIRI